MKEKIIEKILSIPVKEWYKNVIMINEVSITIREGASGQRYVWLMIDGVEFNDPRIREYYERILEYRKNNEEQEKENKLKAIYSKICI